MIFERFSVIRVPFPFTDRRENKNRPALVLTDATNFNIPNGHAVMAMITSQGNQPWTGDCIIKDLTAAGLRVPSRVRFKLFTLDLRLVRGKIGQLSTVDAQAVQSMLAQLLGLANPLKML